MAWSTPATSGRWCWDFHDIRVIDLVHGFRDFVFAFIGIVVVAALFERVFLVVLTFADILTLVPRLADVRGVYLPLTPGARAEKVRIVIGLETSIAIVTRPGS